jgi:hypothetical protein
MSQIVENWAKNFPRRNTPGHTVRHRYQIQHCGPEEVRVSGGGSQVWADGLDSQRFLLQETKFIRDPKKSPFVANSNVPAFIRKKVVNQVEDEFARYAAVINDPNTPVTRLEVIVNRPEAVSFFENLLNQYNIPSHVIVKP